MVSCLSTGKKVVDSRISGPIWPCDPALCLPGNVIEARIVHTDIFVMISRQPDIWPYLAMLLKLARNVHAWIS